MMDTWETHYRVSESGASRSLIGIDLTDVDITYTGHLVANEQSATLVASGSTNFRDTSDNQAEQEDECVSHAIAKTSDFDKATPNENLVSRPGFL